MPSEKLRNRMKWTQEQFEDLFQLILSEEDRMYLITAAEELQGQLTQLEEAINATV